MTRIVRELTPVAMADRTAILAAPGTTEAHRALMAALPAMTELQSAGSPSRARLTMPLTVAAWNVERCLFPEASAAHLAPHGPALVLLSEVDSGMARTGQRNTTAAMAEAMGMAFAYGVEFHELDLGGATERRFCKDGFNATGWHGNGILSAAPFEALELIRLDDHGHWFVPAENATDPGQPRVGGRMAVAAVIPTDQGPICAVSTHLESNADSAHRARQMEVLLDALDRFAPGLPTIIGGDLNTGNHAPPDYDWRGEALFDLARGRGFHWDANAEGFTTRPSLITPHPGRKFKLDWFALKGLTGSDNLILSSEGADGTPLSDHDAVLTTVRPA